MERLKSAGHKQTHSLRKKFFTEIYEEKNPQKTNKMGLQWFCSFLFIWYYV